MSNLITWLKDNCSYAFLETYGFDGHDIRKKKIATSQGYNEFWRARSDDTIFPYTLHFGLILASFLGLPTRLAKISKSADYQPIYTLHLDWLQFFRGLIGGWDPIKVNGKAVWTTKKKLQVAALFPIKFPIIFLVKILTFPFKLLINIVKLFTEFLPTVIVYIFGPPLSKAWGQFVSTCTDKKLGPWRFLQAVPYLLLTILALIPFLVSRGIKFFGMTLTSPDKSARISYTWVYKSTRNLLKLFGVKKHSLWGRGISFTLGALAAILSILTTAGLWAIAFPMIIGAVFTYFPALLNAFAWLGQFPIITSGIATLESMLAVVGVGTAAAYGAFIATLSGFLSIQVTGMMLLVGTALGAIAAPVCSIISRLADALGNAWATWQNEPLKTKLGTLVFSPHRKKDPDDPLTLSRSSTKSPRRDVVALVEESVDDFELASSFARNTTASGRRVEEGDGPILILGEEPMKVSDPLLVPIYDGP